MSIRLTTQISKAFWCTSKGAFSPATIPLIQQKEISWLDMLFEGGILLPEAPKGEKRALSILLTGQPGTGKSTLALELCYRWALNSELNKNKKGLSTLYITSETTEEWAIQKAKDFGWEHYEKTIIKNQDYNHKLPIPLVAVWQTIDFQYYLNYKSKFSSKSKQLLDSLSNIFGFPQTSNAISGGLAFWNEQQIKKRLKQADADILVIDSLNCIEPSKRDEIFNKFTKIVSGGPKIIITILESDTSRQTSEFWEYLSDIVIRLDQKNILNYMIRTIEIKKARYQSHVWGIHQLKFLQKSDLKEMELQEKRRAHPYRTEGGIFIFPSIHYYLSKYKRLTPSITPKSFITPIPSLNKMLHGGFPRGRCIGFIGTRGGHKSHLGYLCVLFQVVKGGRQSKKEKALIISLRDDEGVARKTMSKILKEDLQFKGSLKDLEEDEKLEILYFPPGYITPEEFYHRMFMSIQRLKSGDNNVEVTVLFNSIDQLASRFPLCAREQIFIPGIIETFSAENITSFFIAVRDKDQPSDYYGLLSMADVLISFDRDKIPKVKFFTYLDNHLEIEKEVLENIKSEWPDEHQTTIMRIMRFAGGQEAGDGGILELIHKESKKHNIYGREGLRFVPF